MNNTPNISFRDYLELCKPRVVALMIITALVAMLLATPAGSMVPLSALIWGNIGIALTGFSGGAINHLIDRRIDAKMARTHKRPIAAGRIKPRHAIVLATVLGCSGLALLVCCVNLITAVLSFLTLVGYAVIYTVFLKRATPQNIVIGGLAGAMPPLLGWTAVTGQIDAAGLLLVLIIFTWTPPHFWALSIYRHQDYAKAEIPMLPVTHGIHYTKINVLLYTLLMIISTYLPFVIGMSGLIYLIGVSLLNAGFLYYAIRLYLSQDIKQGLATFRYSIFYLLVLFVILLVDHYYFIMA